MSKEILSRLEALERKLTPPARSTEDVTFGARLAEMRGRRGLSLRALADIAGISNPYLSQLENDHSIPSAKVLHALARHFGVSMDYLWTGK